MGPWQTVEAVLNNRIWVDIYLISSVDGYACLYRWQTIYVHNTRVCSPSQCLRVSVSVCVVSVWCLSVSLWCLYRFKSNNNCNIVSLCLLLMCLLSFLKCMEYEFWFSIYVRYKISDSVYTVYILSTVTIYCRCLMSLSLSNVAV